MWQKIDSAPKDTVIDLFVTYPKNRAGFKGFRYTDCYQNSRGEWTSKNFNPEDNHIIKNPSHWMPQPDSPIDTEGF